MAIIIADQENVSSHLHRRPFKIKHTLSNHPLFRLERLIELAKNMPGDKIEYNSGNLAPDTRPEDVPTLNMSVEEVMRRIENYNAWLVIKRVDVVEEYRKLLREFIADLSFLSQGQEKNSNNFEDLQGFVFVSSAHATTPFHFDAEENILLQLKGEKFVHIFDNEDRTLISEESLELSPSKHRNQRFLPEFEAKDQTFFLEPGEGVHIPYTWPHWVHTGSEYSLSIAMTWKTKKVQRLNKIRLVNGSLRRAGIPQSYPGVHPFFDHLKVWLHDIVHAFLKPFRKSERIRKFLRSVIYGRESNYYYQK